MGYLLGWRLLVLPGCWRPKGADSPNGDSMPPIFETLCEVELPVFCAGSRDAVELRAQMQRALEAGSTRREWCWLAADKSGAVLARHSWWGRPGADVPIGLDLLSSEDPVVAAELLVAARERIGVDEAWCELTAPIEQSAGPSATEEPLVGLLEAAGFAFAVARVTLEWTTASEIGADSGRLCFRPARSLRDEVLVGLFAAVGDGSLDRGMIDDRAVLGVDTEARRRLETVRGYRGEPDWFTVGSTPAGEPVGYVVPARTIDASIIAEIGVANGHRAKRYVDDLLAFGTGVLADANAERILADTDLANHAMRAAFARGGYRELRWRDDYRWRRSHPSTAPRGGASESRPRPSQLAVPHLEPRSLLTARLLLSPLVEADSEELAGVLDDPGLYRFIEDPPPALHELTERYRRLSLGARSPDRSQVWCNWVVRTHDGRPVGTIQATLTDQNTRAEMAWVTGRADWGNGYAGEAAVAVATWLAGVGVGEITAHVHPDNRASAGVARHIGLEVTEIVHNGEQLWKGKTSPGRAGGSTG